MSATATIQEFQVILPPVTVSKSRREMEAFFRLLPELLPKYEGQHVVIHDEKVYDVGSDPIELSLRVRAKIGKVDLYIGLVDEHQPVYRMGGRYSQVHPLRKIR